MTCWPISPRVGNVKNKDPSPIEPIADRMGETDETPIPFPNVACRGRRLPAGFLGKPVGIITVKKLAISRLLARC